MTCAYCGYDDEPKELGIVQVPKGRDGLPAFHKACYYQWMREGQRSDDLLNDAFTTRLAR